jgi:serine/threonine-protein kinase
MASTVPAVVSPEIGKYYLVAELARGGMGNVYLGIAQGPGGFHKLLVVKELRPEFAEDATYVAMFLEEARLAARLTHPNIVQTYEVGSDGSRHFMIMEHLDGRSLHRVAKYLARQGGMPVGAHLRVIAEALLGLHYAHELRGFDGEQLGVVHRDVSPLNLLLTFDGQAKVLDFGIAKAIDSSLETQAGVLKGRIAYMAPEQARGAKCDRRVDVYAAGVMIWEAAAGRRLWQGMSDIDILTKTLSEGAPRLRSALPAAPADLDALCARAMSSNPDARYPTAADLLADLERHLLRRDDMMSMREIGAMASKAFAPERERMNGVIEDVLARMRGSVRSGVMPARGAQPMRIETPSYAYPRALGEELPSVASFLTATPSAQERAARSRSAILAPRPTVPEGFARQRPAWMRAAVTAALAVAAGLVVTIVISVVVGIVVRRDYQGKADPRPALPAVVAPLRPNPAPVESAPPPAPSAVTTHSEPRPPSNVFPIAPRLVAPARGAASPSQVQRALRSDSEPSRPGSAAESAPGSGPSSRPEVDPAGGRAPLRPIVTSNPYGSQ